MTERKGLLDRLREDARADYEERAAIMEFDGGLSREQAEQAAYESLRRDIKACRPGPPHRLEIG